MDNSVLGSTSARYAIGIDLGATNVRVGLVRSDGRILRLLRQTAARGGILNVEATMHQLVHLVDDLLAAPEAAGLHVDGVGLGAAGQVDRHGDVVGTNGPRECRWEEIPLRALLGQCLKLDVPVCVDNDSKAAAWGEYLYGAGRGTNCMICLTVGTGVGGGIVVDGKLFHGASGLAGHLGLVSVDMHGQRCPSGAMGCLEHYASGTGIARAARKAVRVNPGSVILDMARGDIDAITTRMVFEAARGGDPVAEEVIVGAAYALGIGVASLLHVFNPDVVVIGGGVAEQGDIFLEPVRRTVEECSMVNFAATPLRLAELGNLAGVVGAAALCWP